MDFTLGDIFSLKAAAIDHLKFNKNDPDNPDAILYYPGTQAKIVKILDDLVYLEFPSGEIVPHNPEELLLFFNRIINKKLVYTRVTTHYGTPPIGLREYMPADTDWKKNYRYKVTIESEERTDKTQMCPTPDCYNDLVNIPKDNEGLQLCPVCGIKVISITLN